MSSKAQRRTIRTPMLETRQFSFDQAVWPIATPPLPKEECSPSKKLKTAPVTLTQVNINGVSVAIQPLERAILRRLHADREKVVDILTLAQNTSGLGSITTTKVMGVVAKLRKTFEQHVLAGVQIERVLEPNGYRLIGVKSFSDDIE